MCVVLVHMHLYMCAPPTSKNAFHRRTHPKLNDSIKADSENYAIQQTSHPELNGMRLYRFMPVSEKHAGLQTSTGDVQYAHASEEE